MSARAETKSKIRLSVPQPLTLTVIILSTDPAALLHLLLGRGGSSPPPPRAHYPVLDTDGRTIGELSSGALSPSLSIGIGMAYLPAEYSKLGTRLKIQFRERTFPAEVVKKPFYRPGSQA